MGVDYPETPLDDAAERIDALDDSLSVHSTSPSELLDANNAVTLPLRLYGDEFTVFVHKTETRHRGTQLYLDIFEDDDALETDESYSRLSKLQHIINESSFDDEEVAADTPHLLATGLGYLTRLLLDGREYGYYAEHGEPKVSDLE